MPAVPLAYISSPSTNGFDVGPFTIHLYGLTILLAIVAAVALIGYRWTRRGGDWDLVLRAALWGVLAGLVGARAYHLLTSWDQDPTIHAHWWGPFAIWKGGLGVWGGILFGCLAGAIVVKRAGVSVLQFMDVAAPGLLLAQGIGRWGNYFNQELYGKPTTLPWGLKIDPQHRVQGYEQFSTFHPTFLYEFIWDLLMVGVLLLVDKKFRIKPPGLFALYVASYCAFRAYEETLRIDPAHTFLGQRVNFWVAIVLFAVSAAFFVWWQFFHRSEDEDEEKAAPLRPAPEGPAMAIPKGRVRSGR
jgi:phosphatidylglycerol---prolipoprotein diacylglyceryl transferase